LSSFHQHDRRSDAALKKNKRAAMSYAQFKRPSKKPS
jgi:hypothetical protein